MSDNDFFFSLNKTWRNYKFAWNSCEELQVRSYTYRAVIDTCAWRRRKKRLRNVLKTYQKRFEDPSATFWRPLKNALKTSQKRPEDLSKTSWKPQIFSPTLKLNWMLKCNVISIQTDIENFWLPSVVNLIHYNSGINMSYKYLENSLTQIKMKTSEK